MTDAQTHDQLIDESGMATENIRTSLRAARVITIHADKPTARHDKALHWLGNLLDELREISQESREEVTAGWIDCVHHSASGRRCDNPPVYPTYWCVVHEPRNEAQLMAEEGTFVR